MLHSTSSKGEKFPPQEIATSISLTPSREQNFLYKKNSIKDLNLPQRRKFTRISTHIYLTLPREQNFPYEKVSFKDLNLPYRRKVPPQEILF